MMTLLPMAAFADPVPDRFASAQTFTVNKTEVDADYDKAKPTEGDYAELTVYVYDDGNNALPKGTPVYVASSRGTTDKIFDGDADAASAGIENVYVVKSGDNGKTTFKVKSSVAGEAKIGIGFAPKSSASLYQYLIGDKDVNADTVQLIGVKDVTFKATAARNIDLHEVKVRDRANDKNVDPTKDGEVYTSANFSKANDLDYYTYKVRVTNSTGAPVADQTVDFSINKSKGRLDVNSAKTDNNGIATVKVFAREGGDYKVTATISNDSESITVRFGSADANTIRLVSDDNSTKARDTAPSFEFEVLDSVGNKVKNVDGADVTVEMISKPSGYDFKVGNITKGMNSDDNFEVAFDNSLTREGKYTLRLSLKNGNYTDVTFNVQEQGKIVGLKVNFKAETITLNTVTKKPSIKLVDAAGVEKDANLSNLEFSLSDASKGAIVSLKDSNNKDYKAFKATHDKDYVGPVTITVIENVYDVVGTYTLTVVDQFSSLKIDELKDNVEVGKDAVVEIKPYDVKGNVVAIGDKSVQFDGYYVTQKPDGATVTVEEASGFSKGLTEKGVGKLIVNSNKAGVVEFVAKVKVGDTYHAATGKVTFGEPKAAVGAKNVTMFIGSAGYVVDGVAATMDQAPFIQDNRTFVPVRMVATALGATNQDTMWDAATQTVTLVRPDMTVTMTIGSNVLTKSDGTTVVADVAPFIVAETGRTVLPFRAIAEAFGADVEAVFAADGTVTAVTFAQ
jgi:hypothetical protein